MPRITISYRRDDSGVITGRIFDRLSAHFGRESVFRDIDNIPPGADFRQHINQVLDESDIVLAVVGPRWVGPARGPSRLANPADPVRLEIETVLRKGKPLIPVLVLRANMPRVEQLPDSLQDFAYRNAVSVDASQDFDVHMARLIRAMDRIVEGLAEGDAPAGAEQVEAEVDVAPSEPEPILDEDALPEAAPPLSAEIEAIREANRELEAQVAAVTEAQQEEARKAAQVRDEVAAALFRKEQEAKVLAAQLAAAQRSTATVARERDDLQRRFDELAAGAARQRERELALQTELQSAAQVRSDEKKPADVRAPAGFEGKPLTGSLKGEELAERLALARQSVDPLPQRELYEMPSLEELPRDYRPALIFLFLLGVLLSVSFLINAR